MNNSVVSVARSRLRVFATSLALLACFASLEGQSIGPAVNPAANQAADPALVPPKINTAPSSHYDSKNLDFALNQGLEITRGGRIWSCWVSGEDGEGGFHVLASSDDQGLTWSKPRVVVHPHDPALPHPRRALVGTLWIDPQGRLWHFFDQSMINFDGRAGVWASVCANPDARKPVWSEPRRIWHGAALNKPIVRTNGEWLLPVSIWDRVKIREMPFQEAFRELDPLRGANVLVSSDQGKTWNHRGFVQFPNPDYDEHMLIERRDGSLWMTARTKGSMWETISTDGGVSWSAPRESSIVHRNSRHFIRRLQSGRILLVKHGLRVDVAPASRTDLTAFLSEDDGLTWQGGLLLDAGASVSYPDGTQAANGTILVSYDNERTRKGEILMARFTEDDILAGRFASKQSAQRLLISRAEGLTVAQQETARKRGAMLQKQRQEHEAAAKNAAKQ